jgi:hypothetical protein
MRLAPAVLAWVLAQAASGPVGPGVPARRAVDPAPRAEPVATARLDAGFRRMYELRFDAARSEIGAYQRAYPEDPVGIAAEAASYLFEEFDRQGVLTSEFFLDDDRLLGGIAGRANDARRAAFLAANRRARTLAESRLRKRADDADALFALTLADGMEGDFLALLEKRGLASLGPIKRAERNAERLLVLRPNAADAYVAIGAANYIVGSLPAYKRLFVWFGGVRGDRERGMQQLARAAEGGHYLKPLAKALLALASRRERQPERARILLEELTREFPANPTFARELALARAARR